MTRLLALALALAAAVLATAPCGAQTDRALQGVWRSVAVHDLSGGVIETDALTVVFVLPGTIVATQRADPALGIDPFTCIARFTADERSLTVTTSEAGCPGSGAATTGTRPIELSGDELVFLGPEGARAVFRREGIPLP
jgi:hypothetical protein